MKECQFCTDFAVDGKSLVAADDGERIAPLCTPCAKTLVGRSTAGASGCVLCEVETAPVAVQHPPDRMQGSGSAKPNVVTSDPVAVLCWDCAERFSEPGVRLAGRE